MEHWQRRLVLGEPFNIGWQVAKALRNRRKHGVEFAEAVSVLDDPSARSEPFVEGGEQREKLIGRSSAGRLLAVAVLIVVPIADEEAEDMGFIRIISARAATPTEAALYRS
jgi:uncharacterized DUF497 family protein